MPDEDASGLQDSRELVDHFRIVARTGKEAERSEEVDDRVELRCPAAGHLSHVTLGVLQIRADASFASEANEVLGVVEAINLESSFGEKMSVSSLPARDVKNSGSMRKAQNVNDTGCFVSVALEREDWLILEQIPGVEIRLPPLGCFSQKKTGSLYAPNTSSIAARIS